MNDNRVNMRVWGDYACFTRPEMKVERVSYPVMTPSAARGILEAIFWEPQIHYLVDMIRIVKRGEWFSFRRNEVTNVISFDSVKTWMKEPEKVRHIEAGGGAKDGTQRNMMALRDVEYLITAEIRLTELGQRAPHGLPKYLDEIRRRLQSGKCFHRPALGVREFAADFEFIEDVEAEFSARVKDPFKEDAGLMLYDVFSIAERAKGFQWLPDIEEIEISAGKTRAKKDAPRFAGAKATPQAYFFHANIIQSTLDCHPDRVKFAGA